MYHFFKLLPTLVQSLSYTIMAKQRGKRLQKKEKVAEVVKFYYFTPIICRDAMHCVSILCIQVSFIKELTPPCSKGMARVGCVAVLPPRAGQ